MSALVKLGFIGEGGNLAAIERGLGLMMEQYYGMTLGEVRNLDMPEVAQDIENLLYGQPFQVPAQFAFTGRAIGTLVGVSTGLAPDFNFVDVATPYARKFLGLDAESLGQTAQEVFKQAIEIGGILLSLPRMLERVVSKIETGQIEVKLANMPGGRRGRGRRRGNGHVEIAGSGSGGGGLSWAFMFAVALAAGIFLTTAHLAAPGWFCLGLAAVSLLGMWVRR